MERRSGRSSQRGELFGRNLMAAWLAMASLIATPVVSADLRWQALDDPVGDAMVLPDAPLAEALGAIALLACRGEYEPASFVLRSGVQPLTAVSITATDLASEQGHTIHATSVDLRYVQTWYQADTAWSDIQRKGSDRRRLVPELLVKDASLLRVDHERQRNFVKVQDGGSFRYVDVSADGDRRLPMVTAIAELRIRDSEKLSVVDLPRNTSLQVWITVQVPSDAAAGDYSGSIVIEQGEQRLARIPLALTVLPFELPPPELEYSIYYRGVLARTGSISSERKSPLQMRAELENMLRHGISNPTVYQPFEDVVGLREVLTMRNALGMRSRRLYSLGITTNDTTATAVKDYGGRVAELRRLAREFGVDEVYVYGIDEAPDATIHRQRPAWQRVHEAGGKVFAAGWRAGHFEMIGDVIDLFVSGVAPSRLEVGRFHSAGKRIFLYNRPQGGVENPLAYRRAYGIELWQYGYDGAMTYAYQHGFGSVWNDFDHPRLRDHNFTYPTENGVLDTIAWEGMREGIDDVRYLGALRRAITNAGAKGAARSNSVDEAERFLDRLRASGRGSPSQVRRAVIAQILRLAS